MERKSVSKSEESPEEFVVYRKKARGIVLTLILHKIMLDHSKEPTAESLMWCGFVSQAEILRS